MNGEEEGLTDRSLLDMEHIWDFIHTVDVNDIREVLERQKTYNMAIAREEMRGKYGSNIGALLLDMNGNDVRTRTREAMAAAGSDARMNGCELPGYHQLRQRKPGNHSFCSGHRIRNGAGESMKIPCTGRMALSDLTTIHQKTPIGRLSAYCGAVSAGAGSGAGIAYLRSVL